MSQSTSSPSLEYRDRFCTDRVRYPHSADGVSPCLDHRVFRPSFFSGEDYVKDSCTGPGAGRRRRPEVEVPLKLVPEVERSVTSDLSQ